MFAVNFVFFLGITQTGIVFSAMMRIAKSGWSAYYARLGEILTLSFIPVAVIAFLIFYFGGVDHVFYWASAYAPAGGHHAEHISPWLGKGFFLWRYILTVPLFYLVGYCYFRTGRLQEKNPDSAACLDTRRNVLAAFTLALYLIVNTNVAWDFGMMIYKHWESSIFPSYFALPRSKSAISPTPRGKYAAVRVNNPSPARAAAVFHFDIPYRFSQ